MATSLQPPSFGLPLTAPAINLQTYEALRGDASAKVEPSNYRLIYESRDGLIRCFEDRDGHLSAVNPARFV